MRELTSENAARYLRETGRVPEGASITVRELSGGVSNVVLRVDVTGRPLEELQGGSGQSPPNFVLGLFWSRQVVFRLGAMAVPSGLKPIHVCN